MIKTITLLLLLSFSYLIKAQLSLDWSNEIEQQGGAFSITSKINSVKHDAFGNVYIGGGFSDTTDFDLSSTGGLLVSDTNSGGTYLSNAFIAKYDPMGNFLWVRKIINPSGTNVDAIISLDVDPSGNIYGAGYMPSGGGTDNVVVKYSSAGVLQFQHQLNGAYPSQKGIIVAYEGGNLYLANVFFGTEDLSPGAPVSNFTSSGQSDIYFMQLNANTGLANWIKKVGGSGYDRPYDIECDGTHVYLTGSYSSVADFDPDAAIYNLGSGGGTDIFIARYLASTGAYSYAHTFNSSSNARGYDIEFEGTNNIYFTAQFTNTVDFQTGAGTFNLSSKSPGFFVSSLLNMNKNTLAVNWGDTIPGSYSSEIELVSDGTNVYGLYQCLQGTYDMDPGAGVSNVNVVSNWDKIAFKYDNSYGFILGEVIHQSSASSYQLDIDDDGSGGFFAVGDFSASVNLDPANISNVTYTNTDPLGYNYYVNHYNTCLSGNNTTTTASICETGTKALTSSVGGGSWSIVAGGGSILGTNYTPANITSNTSVTVRYTDGCGNTTDRTFTVNVNEIASNTTSTGSICETGTKVLVGSPTGGTWSVISGGGTISGTTYTPANVTSNTSVTVRYTIPANGACIATTSDRVFTVNVEELANNTMGTTDICVGDSRTVTGTPSGGTWSEIGAGNIITGTYIPPNLLPGGLVGVSTIYTIAANGACSSNSDTVNFSVVRDSAVFATSSTADMCNGDTRGLIGVPAGGVWSIISGLGTILNDTLTATGSGTIQLKYRVVGQCSTDSTIQNITVSNSIAVSITSSSSSLCDNQTRALTGNPTGGMWNVLSGSANLTGGILTPNGSGTVEIEYSVTSSCGNGEDTVSIVINPIPNANAGIDENICLGDTVILTATGGGVYQWTPGPATANNQVFPTVTTGYRVDVTSDSGCIASDSLTVFVQTSGTATAQNDQAIVTTGVQESIDIYTNDIGGINSLQILSGANSGIVTLSGGNVIYTSTVGYLGNDTIEYEICDANCQTVCDTAFLYITVESDLAIPIGVSPNGDGRNDVFNILGLSRYPNNSLKVFNRWGSLIFDAQPYLNDWNGQSTSGEVIEGTYFYILELGEDIEAYNGYIELKK